MNKNDLISKVAGDTGLTKSDAANAIESVLDTITAQLASGGEVRLIGFGTFLVTRRNASTGRNPQTGEKIQIKAAELPKFRAGKKFKEVVGN